MSSEIPENDAPRDLLGAPYDQARETWGRPSYKKTPENQTLVTVLKGAGWSNERIANRLGIDPGTLRKHFSAELSAAADSIEAEALLRIYERMREGNVAAARTMKDLAAKGRAAPPQPREADPDPSAADAQAEEKMGKKESLTQAAKTPSGDWGNLLN